jgi:alpha-beta hydrolase superfamily lysophospholipase
MSLCASFIDSQDKVMTYAKKVVYPYLIVLGEKDVIVSNSANREWHSKTSTPAKQKEMKLMAGSYHELAKEPNRTTLMQKRLADTEKPGVPFGIFDPKKEMKVA